MLSLTYRRGHYPLYANQTVRGLCRLTATSLNAVSHFWCELADATIVSTARLLKRL